MYHMLGLIFPTPIVYADTLYVIGDIVIKTSQVYSITIIQMYIYLRQLGNLQMIPMILVIGP